MATIFERKNSDGTITYRMMIRRKSLPKLILSFLTKEEAERWVKIHEYRYIQDPDSYQKWITSERLNLKREREFSRN